MSTIEPRTFPLKGGSALLRCPVDEDAETLIANGRENAAGPYNVTSVEEFTFTVEQEWAWIEEHRVKPGWLAVVAEVEGRVVGLLNFRNGLRRRIAHRGTFGMSVVESCRRRGVGDALLTTLLDWARAEPLIDKVCLAVLADNTPARALYEKHGFLVEGRRPREIKLDDGTVVDDVLMYRFVAR